MFSDRELNFSNDKCISSRFLSLDESQSDAEQ